MGETEALSKFIRPYTVIWFHEFPAQQTNESTLISNPVLWSEVSHIAVSWISSSQTFILTHLYPMIYWDWFLNWEHAIEIMKTIVQWL